MSTAIAASVAQLQHALITDELARSAPDRSLKAWMVAADHLTWALEARLALSDRHQVLAELTDSLREELACLHDWLADLVGEDVITFAEWAETTTVWAQRRGAPPETQAVLDWLLDDHGPIALAMQLRHPFQRPAHDGVADPTIPPSVSTPLPDGP